MEQYASAAVPVVLFTCAGQRVDIVQAFGRAGATTLAVDVNELAPALYAADRRALVPPVDDPGYIAALARARRGARRRGSSSRSPTSTTALLAARRDELGALVLLPGPGDDRALRGQVRGGSLLRGERRARRRRRGSRASCRPTIPFPVLVKARRGFGSRHIYRAETGRSSTSSSATRRRSRWCSRSARGEEFSIDVFCDLEGRCLGAVPRTMIESKGGESIKGMTIRDEELIEHGRRVSETMGIVGPANIQCFREPDGSLPVTDVNPRFGGGFPLPTAAGSGFPELALALARGERPEPRLGEFREGVVMTRFFSQVILENGAGGRWNRSATPDRGQYPAAHARTSSPARPGSSARTSPRRSPPPATRSTGIDCFTDYYDSALKEENARGPRRPERLDLAEDELDFGGFDGVFHLAGQPGVRSFGDVFPLYLRRNVLASQRVFEAAARDGVARRLRLVVVGLRRRRALPDAGGHDAAAALALRDHEARLRAPRRRVRARVRPRLRGAALLQRLRAAAAARHGVHADRERARSGHGVRALRRRRPVARLDVRRRRRRRHDPAPPSGAPAPTTSAARSRRR